MMEKYVKCPRCRHEFIKRGFNDSNLLRAGRREVVEWVEKRYGCREHHQGDVKLLGLNEIQLRDWQAQKKVWGIAKGDSWDFTDSLIKPCGGGND